MASYIYNNPSHSTERVVITSKSSPVAQRGGRYVGGSMPPIVQVEPRIKRASK